MRMGTILFSDGFRSVWGAIIISATVHSKGCSVGWLIFFAFEIFSDDSLGHLLFGIRTTQTPGEMMKVELWLRKTIKTNG